MGIKSLGKKIGDYACLAASVMAAIASNPFTAEATQKKVMDTLSPKKEAALTIPADKEEGIDNKLKEYGADIPDKPRMLKQNIENFSDNYLYLPKLFANWYAADGLVVLVHEWGHDDAAKKQKLESNMEIEPTPLWVNGWTRYGKDPKNKKDRARIDIAGFVNAGNLAEYLKDEILMGRVPEDELRFKSMLALASELNLPVYLGQYYAGTVPDKSMDDIENFTRNSGISPETMAISSGVHILVNAPYVYHLAKNALGSHPTIPEKKDFALSFRYDGDSYMLYLHSDLDTIVGKLPKLRFILMRGEN